MRAEALERRRLRIQTERDAIKGREERNRLGQFATPSGLAAAIVRYGVGLLPSQRHVHFFDPALGTGAFFSALLQSVPGIQIRRAVGYEIDPTYSRPAAELWGRFGLEVESSDFTSAPLPGSSEERFNFIVCNPPYVRHHHFQTEEKARLRERAFQSSGCFINGLAGLYCYFIAIAHKWMTPDAIAGWLVPSEFMDVNYGRPLKEYLLGRVTLLRLHRFDPNEVQFDDALVSSAVMWFRNSVPSDNHFVEFSFGGSLERPLRSRRVSIRELRTQPKWTRVTNEPRPQATGPTVGDLFVIKRGLATGANDFFILPENEIERLQLPRKFLVPILPGPRGLTEDEIFVDKAGMPVLTKRLFLLNCALDEEVVREEYPALWSYFERGRLAGISQRYLCAQRSPWYAQEKREPAPFLCTYIGRKNTELGRPFRFILNHSNAIAANVYLLLYPKPVLQSALKQEADLGRKFWARLNAISVDALTDEGRVYGGGLHKLEPKELANVRLGDTLGLPGVTSVERADQMILCDRPSKQREYGEV